ncbi:glycoside hydrolase family 31 protein [Amycolatopsis rhizosphaerae]|uniref:Glycoside hydrolase family 31 protein n=1 Tax=Amycolatopsis rhizosphaerae TaxID=2053003 RepID=A0A558A1J8_9PSEU|nr:TIM-barrel domain-containing protein [Amycolatopsis rhizosphaerae]TVT18142.1 glycoside hydrolase family 31 protein [Amycolatopsis rhizosphaerae]
MTGLDPYVGVAVRGDALEVRLKSGRTLPVEVTVPLPGVLRVRLGTPPPAESGMLVHSAEQPADLAHRDGGVEISGPGVEAFWEADGQGFRCGEYQRFSEPGASTVPYSSGYREAGAEWPGGWVETVRLSPDCAVYGGGESYQGINLRKRFRRLRNTEVDRRAGRDTAYLNVPFLWSDEGWGLFLNTGAVIEADLGATHSEAARIEVDGDRLDLFVLSGDPPAMLRQYHALTGLPKPMPDWAFGVWLGRSSYFTADEAVSAVDDVLAADCPVDVVHVDEWLDEVVLDAAAWNTGADRARFPAGWTRRLRERGVRTSLWINPYLGKGTPIAERAAEAGYLVSTPEAEPSATDDNPETLPVDFTSPEARRWWVERLARTLDEEGADAVLADFGEEVAADARFVDGTTGADRHNSYGLLYAEAVAEAGERARNGDFVALSRSGTGGQQRASAQWAGDLPSTWSGLTSTLRACLSMSLSGLAFVTHDAGGYWTPASYRHALELRRTMTPGEIRADVEPELYVRWAQFAAFSPIMRFHGVGAREPTAYPAPARDAVTAICRLRKEWQDYLISAALEATGTGMPMMRPMVLAFPGDRAARDADLQYLLGPDLFVAPLLEPGGGRQLWVPPGDWEPLVGLDPVSGPGWYRVHCELGEFPAWQRA